MRPFVLVLVAVGALVLTACGGASDVGGVDVGDGPAPVAIDGDWLLVDGVDVPEPGRVTLSIDGTEIGGTAACNSYGATAERDGEAFLVSDLFVTEMGCEQDLMTAEADVTTALSQATTATVGDDGRLVVEGGGPTLTFARVEPVPEAELVGTTWRLDGLVTGTGPDGAVSSVRGDEATLLLSDDGTVSAGSGCRTFTGAWQITGDEVTFPTFGQDGTDDCPDELRSQDDHVVTVLGDGFTVTIEGQRLTLTDGDLGLTYTS